MRHRYGKTRLPFAVEDAESVGRALRDLNREERVIEIDRVAERSGVGGSDLREILQFLEKNDIVDLMIAQDGARAEKEYNHGWYEAGRGYVAYVGMKSKLTEAPR